MVAGQTIYLTVHRETRQRSLLVRNEPLSKGGRALSNLHCGRSVDRYYASASDAAIPGASPLSCTSSVTREAALFLERGRKERINSSFRRDTGESAERVSEASTATAATAATASAAARGCRPTNGKDRRRISWVDFACGRSSRRWISPRCSALPRDSLSARRSLCRWHSRCS